MLTFLVLTILSRYHGNKIHSYLTLEESSELANVRIFLSDDTGYHSFLKDVSHFSEGSITYDEMICD